MNATNRYLNRLAQMRGLRSDYAIAKYLGISTAHVSIWRSGSSQFSDDMAFRVARDLDIPAIEIIAEIGAERAKAKETREGWRELLAQFRAGHVVPVFFAAILAAMAFTHVENTAPQAFEFVGAPAPTGQFLTGTYEYYVHLQI